MRSSSLKSTFSYVTDGYLRLVEEARQASMQIQGVEARLPAWKASLSIPQLVYEAEENIARACGRLPRLPAFPQPLPAFFDGFALSSTQHSSLHLLFLPGLCLSCK